MVGKNHNSVFVCGHCGSAFTGRKRKFCEPKCSQDAQDKRKRERGVKPTLTGKRRRPPNPIVDGYRVCLDCERNQPISEFPEYRHAKSGYRGQCKPCFAAFNRRRKREAPKPERNYQMERIRSAINRGEYGPPTREQHEGMRHRRPPPRKKHPTDAQIDRIAKQNAEQAWRYHIKEKASDLWCLRYYKALGTPWRNRRLTDAQRYRLRYHGDPLFQTKEKMRRQLTKAMKRDHVGELIRGAIKRNGKSPTVEDLLGYTIDELMDHIERQFTRGMSWNDVRSGVIHIDHIIPQAAFDLSNELQWRSCWCLSNLRPCWAKENLKKSASRTYLI